MALTDLTRISTSGIATGTSLSGAILHGDAHFRGTQVGVTSALFDSSDDALEFSDNVKLTFGDSGDLSIYHTGGNSIVRDQGTGTLSLQSNGTEIALYNYANSQYMGKFANAAQVELYYAGDPKFQTTSTGAIVTGILTATSFSGPLVGNTNNTSGLSTFYDLRVSNNLTVEGTTTTLDTNLIGVDRVEVGANSNTLAGIAVTQSGAADIVRLFDGSTQVVTVDDTGNVGLGSAIPSGKLDVSGQTHLDHVNISGVTTTSGLTISSTTPVIDFLETDGNPDYRIYAENGELVIREQSPSISNRLVINSTGLSIPNNLSIAGVATFTNSPNAIQMNDNARVSFGTSLKTSISYNASTSRTIIRNWNDTLEIGYRNTEIHHLNQARLTFDSGNTFSNVANTNFTGDSYHAVWIPSSNTFRINDNAKLALGSQTDAEIYHNGGNFYIDNDTGHLYIRNNVAADVNKNIYIQAKSGENSISCGNDGEVVLFSNSISANQAKLQTTGHGVYVTGIGTFTDKLSVTGSQNSQLTNNQLTFDRAGYSYIDQLSDSGSLVFRVKANNTIALRLDSSAQSIFGASAHTIVGYGGTGHPYNNNSLSLYGTANIGLVGQYSSLNMPMDHSNANVGGNWWMLGRVHGTTNEWGLSSRPGNSNTLRRIWRVVNKSDNSGLLDYQSFHYNNGVEALRISSDGKIKFASNNSTTDYLEYGSNPRLWLKCPSGINGMRIDASTTPLEIKNSSNNGKSFSFDGNFNFNVNGDYSLSSGQYDSSGKIFLNATRHNGSTTVTSFQTSIQAVATSNANNTGYLGLGASASPDDLVILTTGEVGIGIINPGRKVHIKDSGIIKLENTSTGGWAGLEWMVSSGTNNYDAYMGLQDSDGLFFIDNNSNGIDFCITQGGNIGIQASTNVNNRVEIGGNSHYVVTNSGQARNGIHIRGQGGNSGEFGGAISFGCNNTGAAAIAAEQMSSDSDVVGLAFFTHESSTGADDAKKRMKINNTGGISLNNWSDNRGFIFQRTGSGSYPDFPNVQGSQGRGMIDGQRVVSANTSTEIARSHWGGLALVGYSNNKHQGVAYVMFGYGGAGASVQFSGHWVRQESLTISFSVSLYSLMISHNASDDLNVWCILIGV